MTSSTNGSWSGRVFVCKNEAFLVVCMINQSATCFYFTRIDVSSIRFSIGPSMASFLGLASGVIKLSGNAGKYNWIRHLGILRIIFGCTFLFSLCTILVKKLRKEKKIHSALFLIRVTSALIGKTRNTAWLGSPFIISLSLTVRWYCSHCV